MKFVLIITLFAALFSSCDTRMSSRYKTSSYMDNASGNTGSGSNYSGVTWVDNGSGTGTGTTTTTGFEACPSSPNYKISRLGSFSTAICRNTITTNVYKASIANAASSYCFVPMYVSGTSSFAIGSAQCSSTQTAQITLSANIAGFTQYPVNGIMIMKYESAYSFFQCMELLRTGSSQATAFCSQWKTANDYLQLTSPY